MLTANLLSSAKIGFVRRCTRHAIRIDIEKLRGTWRNTKLLALDDALLAAGKKAESHVAYQSVLADDDVEKRHRRAAEAAIQNLKP
ncbi:MAG: hypothetical protein ABGZ53_08005 [Fuerstiella sp.]|nr:hypothetical protein [Fuerstiella sp.]